MFTFNIVTASILLAAFLIEFILSLVHHADRIKLKDMMANCSIGLLLLLTGFFEKGIELAFFSLMYKFALFKPDLSWWLWVVGFFSCDFIHYGYHWLGHKTRIFWAAHSTHHSSSFLNLSTGLRTNFIHLSYRFLFWSPLCFLGLPPPVILLFESITATQNYLVHTEKIGKLGILDWLFNTPSNHRVHHGSNPEYIDKNLGGILMIYDHLFGTYQKETIKPVYGITHKIDTVNPIKILFHEYINIGREFPKIKGVFAKVRYLFSPPQ